MNNMTHKPFPLTFHALIWLYWVSIPLKPRIIILAVWSSSESCTTHDRSCHFECFLQTFLFAFKPRHQLTSLLYYKANQTSASFHPQSFHDLSKRSVHLMFKTLTMWPISMLNRLRPSYACLPCACHVCTFSLWRLTRKSNGTGIHYSPIRQFAVIYFLIKPCYANVVPVSLSHDACWTITPGNTPHSYPKDKQTASPPIVP